MMDRNLGFSQRFEVHVNFSDFRELHDFAKRLVPVALKRYRGEALVQAFRRSLSACSLVSFDIFDTLLVRRVAHPAEVFLHLQRHSLFRDVRLAKSIARIRIEAEQAARERLFSLHGSGEVVLPEIFVEFCRMTGLSADAIDYLVRAEETVETALCRPNPMGVELFRIARAEGKDVIAVSDTYHRRAFLQQLLDSTGFPMPSGCLYASSEHRVHKQGGRLFGRVCESRNVAPSKVLHVGDHPISDHQMPESLGMRTLLHGHFVSPHPSPPLQEGDFAWVHATVRAMRSYRTRCERTNEFWRDLGFNVFGPFFTGFCQWLHERFREDRVERAYFLLRDGELLWRVYRSLFGDDGPSLRLLHSSRRAMVLPLWSQAKEFATSNLLVAYEPRPAREFLVRLGLDPKDFVEEIVAAGFQSVDELVDVGRDPSRILKLFGSPAVQHRLSDSAADEKVHLVEYLRHAGIWEQERTALVDTGWNGTIQKAMQTLTNEVAPGRLLGGYYVGTLGRISHHAPPGMAAKSFWDHGGEPVSAAEKFGRLCRMLEIVSSSAMGSVVRFQRTGEAVAPLLAKNPIGQDQIGAISKLQDGILEFAQEWRDLGKQIGNASIPLHVAVEECLRLHASPTKEEAANVGDLALSQDMGISESVCLARFADDSLTPEALWKDYESSAWREGLANRPCAQAAAIRTLLWLCHKN